MVGNAGRDNPAPAANALQRSRNAHEESAFKVIGIRSFIESRALLKSDDIVEAAASGFLGRLLADDRCALHGLACRGAGLTEAGGSSAFMARR